MEEAGLDAVPSVVLPTAKTTLPVGATPILSVLISACRVTFVPLVVPDTPTVVGPLVMVKASALLVLDE